MVYFSRRLVSLILYDESFMVELASLIIA